MSTRNYSNSANVPALASGIDALATSLSLTTVSNWPSAPCYATLDLNGASPEVVLVQSIGSNSMTVLRGQDGTSAVGHDAGVSITHTAVAADFSEANAHVNASTGVHGISGALVGTSDAQTLTNKVVTSPTINTALTVASGSAPAMQLKAAASGSQDLLELLSSSGSLLGKIDIGAGLSIPVIAVTSTAASGVPFTVKGASSQTADLIEAKDGTGNVVTAVTAKGKTAITPAVDDATPLLKLKMPGLSANPIEIHDDTDTIVWRVGALGDQIVTGLALQPNGGFDKANTTDGKFKIDSGSNLVLSGAKATLDATQANNVPVLPALTGRKMHFGNISGNTDASGYITVTHGASFTPLVVICSWSGGGLGGGPGGFMGADNFTSTTFRTRLSNATGVTAVTGGFIALA